MVSGQVVSGAIPGFLGRSRVALRALESLPVKLLYRAMVRLSPRPVSLLYDSYYFWKLIDITDWEVASLKIYQL